MHIDSDTVLVSNAKQVIRYFILISVVWAFNVLSVTEPCIGRLRKRSPALFIVHRSTYMGIVQPPAGAR